MAARRFTALVRGVSVAFGTLAALLFALAMLVTCQMVLLRYFFRSPTIWQTDFVVYTATAAVFLGAPYVLLTGGHVGIDVVENAVRERTRRTLRLAGSVLGLAFCGAMLVASLLYFHEGWENDWRTSGVWQIPLWIPTLPLPLGFGLLCLQYVAQILQLALAPPAAQEAR